MRVLFAHGFEGGPSGSKPTYMREVLGWEVTSPIMSGLGWDIESQTKVLLRCIDEHDFDLVIGSSMGGLAWEGLSEDELADWKNSGFRTYRGFELEIDLDWSFMEAAESMSWPEVAHHTTIVHGSKDDVVSLSVSETVSGISEMVELVVIDDGHRMKKCLPKLESLASDLMSR